MCRGKNILLPLILCSQITQVNRQWPGNGPQPLLLFLLESKGFLSETISELCWLGGWDTQLFGKPGYILSKSTQSISPHSMDYYYTAIIYCCHPSIAGGCDSFFKLAPYNTIEDIFSQNYSTSKISLL